MDTSKIIRGVVSSGRYTVTAPIVKEDYGLYLKIEGVELPSTYEVDFSNDEHNGTSVTMIGNSDGVLIPSQFISTGKDVFAFLYHVGADFGRTVYKFRIPNKVRPDRTDDTPTPEQASVIDQAISALNSAVEQTAQDVIDADASAQAASQSAENAHDSAVDAQNYAETAQTSATQASASASQASASATASAQSASQSAQIKTDIEGYVSTAQGYAQTATEKAAQASQSATNASNSATTALTKAGEASASATTASNKASEASGYASTASQKATESAQSASQALSYKNDAESAKTASQTAQGKAEDAQTAAETAQGKAEDAQEAAESAAASVQASAAQIAENTEDIAVLQTDVAQNEADILKAFPTDTASGAIASFSDGANDLPLKSLVVDINPIQDLHGQENPYPAGGGKNKYSGESDVTVDNRLFATVEVAPIPAGTYTISAVIGSEPTGYNGCRIAFRKADRSAIAAVSLPYMANTRTSVSFTLSDTCEMIYFYYSATTAGTGNQTYTNVQIEEGSTATAYAPYENLCPISGWTQVGVEQRGVNVWDEEWEVGGLSTTNGQPSGNNNAIRSKNFIPCLPNTDYYTKSVNLACYLWFYDGDKNFISFVTNNVNKAVTTPSNCRYMKLRVGDSNNPLQTYNHDISINYPSTDHSYHSYTGRSITIPLGQTVYGGKLDVLSGELTVDRAMVDLGTLNWTMVASGQYSRFYSNELKNIIKAPTSPSAIPQNVISSQYETVSFNTAYTATTDGVLAITATDSQAYGNVNVVDSRYASTSDFKTAMDGVQLCYELATPIEIQLSPNQINSLLGTNNIFADTGDSSVEYRADTKLYIERLTAPDSADMIADANITSGKYFMVGNNLYKATANIANGGQIIVGTNCIRKSLSEALNEINA